jgi:hypothetical protein
MKKLIFVVLQGCTKVSASPTTHEANFFVMTPTAAVPFVSPSVPEVYSNTMTHTPAKRQKREEYKNSLHTDEQSAVLPKKKFYRQRAHANPFSDHSLT